MKIINLRSDKDICDRNCVLLDMSEAVKRWTSDGQFMMTEVNGTESYQSKDNNIELGSYSERISKIEAALAGMDFVKEVRAGASEQSPSVQQSSKQSSSDSVSAE